MACRDYDYDSGYDTWLKRGRERLDQMAQMLHDFRRAAEKEGLAIPEPAMRWFTEDHAGKTGTLSRVNFDAAAQALCALCRAAEEKGLTIPAAVVPWWTEHKAADDHAAELAQGLETSPIHADFWAAHAAKLAMTREVPGIPLEAAIKALEKAGLRVLRRGKTITMANDTQQILLSRQDPVNPFALGGILNRLGIDDEAFRKLL